MKHIFQIISIKGLITGAISWILLFNYGNTQKCIQTIQTVQKKIIDCSLINAELENNSNFINSKVYKWRFIPDNDLIAANKDDFYKVESNGAVEYCNLSHIYGIQEVDEHSEANSIPLRMVYYLDYAEFKKLL